MPRLVELVDLSHHAEQESQVAILFTEMLAQDLSKKKEISKILDWDPGILVILLFGIHISCEFKYYLQEWTQFF